MLGLAGIPATAGFIGKFYLIDAAVRGGYTWLGVIIVIGSMISLGYYLPVIAAMWVSPAPHSPTPDTATGTGTGLPVLAGGSPELDDQPAPLERPQIEVLAVAALAGAGILFLGIVPQPLFELLRHVGTSLGLR
jgi:NADH-quinone oxidoreductase subunit N